MLRKETLGTSEVRDNTIYFFYLFFYVDFHIVNMQVREYVQHKIHAY